MARTLMELTEDMHAFVTAKGWYAPESPRPQTPRNLAASLAIEAAEVLELYQWRDTADPARLAGELADVALYLLQLASVPGLNLEQAIMDRRPEPAAGPWPNREDPGSER